MTFHEQLLHYQPFDECESQDVRAFMQLMDAFDDNVWTRENRIGHISASSWVLNKDHTKVLLAYHNIFQNYAWLGGHADGDKDLAQVAIKETIEESSVSHVKLLSPDIFDVCAIYVVPHIKRGQYVSSHIHYNVTYLLEADETDPLHIAEGENSDVKWVPLEDVLHVTREPSMRGIYQRLIDKVHLMSMPAQS